MTKDIFFKSLYLHDTFFRSDIFQACYLNAIYKSYFHAFFLHIAISNVITLMYIPLR